MNKYLTYRIEDYLTDDEFINSITDANHKQKWTEWLGDKPEQAKVYYEARELIQSLKFKEEAFTGKDSVWERIEHQTNAKSVELSTSTNPRRYIWIAGAIAAGLALIFVTFFQESSSLPYDNPGLALESMILPEDSKVTAITGNISYDQDNWETERRVQLDGSATFEVTKGVPFIVETPNGTVRVLGTKFTVSSKGDSFAVDVEHGRVRVTSGNNSQVLTANMSFRKNALVASKTADSGIIYHQYDNASLEDIIKALESSYDVKINLKDISQMDKTYTGFFDSANLKTALQSVFWPLGMTYEITGNEITIESE